MKSSGEVLSPPKQTCSNLLAAVCLPGGLGPWSSYYIKLEHRLTQSTQIPIDRVRVSASGFRVLLRRRNRARYWKSNHSQHLAISGWVSWMSWWLFHLLTVNGVELYLVYSTSSAAQIQSTYHHMNPLLFNWHTWFELKATLKIVPLLSGTVIQHRGTNISFKSKLKRHVGLTWLWDIWNMSLNSVQ